MKSRKHNKFRTTVHHSGFAKLIWQIWTDLMGEKIERKINLFGDKYTKPKTSSLNQLFKDFKIKW